ncbi:MntP/YtaF family protein [Paenibacillus sp. FSL K6-1230]|uniref:MntP/YtaF family protein n=1 Tax=Paenibacillus sp. FSL K6-1230 TaxID=2921603 RepID=UPI00039E1496
MGSHWMSLLLLAFALSLDSFGVGVTYGLRKMKIPLLSIVIISVCSGMVIWVSMQVGVIMQKMLSPTFTTLLGALILIGIGCWSLVQSLIQKHDDTSSISLVEQSEAHDVNERATVKTNAKDTLGTAVEQTVFSLELRKLGLVIRILRSPSAADMDDSGSISPHEAVWLGIALSLDAFGAGLGAAMLGFDPFSTALAIALFSGIFLIGGMKAGFRLTAFRFMRTVASLPALLLIIMGILRLM